MINKNYIFFDIESTEVVEENPDSRFMSVKIHAFSSGKNLHKMTTSIDTLKKTAPTLYDAPIIYNIVKSKKDFGSHVSPEDSLICGFCVPNTAEFSELEDGRTGLFVQARISKRYAPDVVEILKRRDGNSKISVEMELIASHMLDDGYEEMDDFIYYAVCLLGVQYQEASPLAHLEVLSFAKQNEEYMKDYNLEFSNKYADIDFTIPKELKSAAKKSLDIYKEKGESATSVSLAMARFIVNNEKITVEKVKAMAKYFNQKTEKTNVAIGFYGGKSAAQWSKGIVDSINTIDEKRLSYFEEGDIITFPYSKLEDVPENMKKLDGVPLTLEQVNQISKVADAIGVDKKKNGYAIAKSQFKKSHVIKDGSWVKKEVKEEMSVKLKKTDAIKEAEVKFSLTSSQITEILNNVLSEIKYGEDQWRRYWVYNFDSEYAYFHDNEASKDFRAKYSIDGLIATVDIEGKEEVVEGCPIPVESKEYVPEFEDEEFAESDKKDEPEGEPEDKPKEADMAVEEDDKEKDPENPEDKPEDALEGEDKPKEAKMSLDANLDVAALLAMLEEETEGYKELVAQHESGQEMNYSALCSAMYAKMCKMSDESKAAKEDKDVYMSELESLREFKATIEKQQLDYAIEKTLQEVADVFSKEEIETAREEVKAFTADTITAWQSDIKSKAFSRIRETPKKKENFTRMATVNSWLNRSNESSEDVSKKYAKEGWLPKN